MTTILVIVFIFSPSTSFRNGILAPGWTEKFKLYQFRYCQKTRPCFCRTRVSGL